MLPGHYVCPDCQSGHNRRSLKAIKVPKLRKEPLNGARGPWDLWLALQPPEGGREQSWRGNINLMGLSFPSWDTLNKYAPSYFHSQSFLSQMILGSETKQYCMGGPPRAPVSRRIPITVWANRKSVLSLSCSQHMPRCRHSSLQGQRWLSQNAHSVPGFAAFQMLPGC